MTPPSLKKTLCMIKLMHLPRPAWTAIFVALMMQSRSRLRAKTLRMRAGILAKGLLLRPRATEDVNAAGHEVAGPAGLLRVALLQPLAALLASTDGRQVSENVYPAAAPSPT